MQVNMSAFHLEALVDRCLDQMGPLEVSEETHKELMTHAESEGLTPKTVRIRTSPGVSRTCFL